MTTQLLLPLSTRKPKAEQARDDAEQLIGVMRLHPQLQRRPAAALTPVLGWNDRRLRAAAEAAQGRVLSAPGTTGYRLAESATVADYYATERKAYMSQIRVMEARVCAMDKAVHGAKRTNP